MRKTVLALLASTLLSAPLMAQTKDSTAPASTAANPDDPAPGRTIDPEAVRDSWTAAQRDVEDLSALRAHEDAARRKIEEAEASRRRREREEARAAAAAAAAKAKAKAKEDDGVIDLCDSDDEAAGTTKETKGSDGGSNGGGSDKENEVVDEVEAIPAKEPTRAELAAAAAKRRAQYEAHIASFGGGGGTGKGGGYIQGGQIVSGPPPVAGGGGGGNPLLNPPGAYVPPAGRSNHDLNIGTDETAECRDVSGSWYSARACLDTGNGGGTLVTKNLATALVIWWEPFFSGDLALLAFSAKTKIFGAYRVR